MGRMLRKTVNALKEARQRTQARVTEALHRLRQVSGGPTPRTGTSGLQKVSTISEARENTVLIVSHAKQQCGINQYGLNVYDALRLSTRYAIGYAECENEDHLDQAMVKFNPSIAIYNYYPATMPWLRPEVTRKYKLAQVGVMHEVTQGEADQAGNALFDCPLCPDPT